MSIVRENVAANNDVLTVDLKVADYQKNVDKAIKTLSQKVEMKGFRKGFVPIGLVRKMYGQSVLFDEINKTIQDKLNAYFKDNNIELLGQPLPVETNDKYNFDINKPEDMQFKYEIATSPEFVLKYNAPVTEYSIQVDDNMLNEEIERLRKQRGKQTNPESNVEENDFVSLELNEIPSNENSEETPLQTTTYIGIDQLNADGKKIFLSKKLNDTFQIKPFEIIEKTEDEINKFILNNKDNKPTSGLFSATITKVTRTEPADLNEDFFKEIYGEECNNEADFKEKLTQEIKQQLDRSTDTKFKNDARTSLVNINTFDLPNDFLKRWITATNEGKLTTDQIENEYPVFEQKTKWDLLSARIAKENNISISHNDLLEHSKQQVRNYFGPYADDARITEIANRLMNDKKHTESTFDVVFEEKVMKAIKDKFEVNKKSVSLDEFKELIKQA